MFFFSDSRCKYKKGNVQVQTEFPFYEPGNLVNGLIYLEIHQGVNAKHIELEVKGSEKTSFIRHWTETHGEGENRRTVHRHEKLKHKKTIMSWKGTCFEIPNRYLAPGVYSLPFQFTLPPNLPSSLYFQQKHTREEPKAKIKYYVKVKLDNTLGDEDFSYK